MAKNKVRSVVNSVKPAPTSGTTFLGSDGFFKLLLCAAVILLYFRSTGFDFTLDDDLFYLKHSSVQKGWEGFSEFFGYGSLNQFDGTTGVQPYRPLTLFYFAFQKELFNNSAAAAHFFNVLLYLLLALLLYSLLKKLLNHAPNYVPAMAALLFVVHPLHTEVICSVKSADELLAALTGFGAWKLFTTAFKNEQIRYSRVLAATAVYFLALLSKESAIAFLAIIPLSVFLLEKKSWQQTAAVFTPLLLATIVFLYVRHQVIGTDKSSTGIPQLENILNAANGWAELTATKAVILFHYLRLVVVPWPLNWDYSYNQIPLTGWSDLIALLGLLIHIALLATAIYCFKKNQVISFALFFFFIASAPVNNVFFINGATLGERLMFVPSFGIMLAIVYACWSWAQKRTSDGKDGKSRFMTPIVLLCIVYAGLSIARAGDWKNNLILFEKGVQRSPNSSRAHYSLASEYLKLADNAETNEERQGYFNKCATHMEESIRIFPANLQAHYNGGICYAKMGDTSRAIMHYRRAVDLDNKYVSAINNLGVIYQAVNNFDSARLLYEMAMALRPNDRIPRKNIGDLFFIQGIEFGKKGDQNKMLAYYRKSMNFTPENIFLLNNMASLFSGRAQYDSALTYLNKGLAIDPQSLMLLENLAAVNYLAKDYNKAIELAQKGLSIKKGSKKSLGVLADAYRALGKQKEADEYLQQFNIAAP